MNLRARKILFWSLCMALPLLGVCASVFVSWRTGDWIWFSRSGALLCVAGSAIFVRDIFLIGLRDFAQRNGAFGFWSSTGPTKTQVMNAVWTYIGFGLASIGTIVWAYGDLVGKFDFVR